MNTHPAGIRPRRERPPTWWSKNWIWCAPLMGGLLIASFVSFFFFIFSFMKSNGAYVLAMERLRASPEVVAALGEPVEDGKFVMGNVQTRGSEGAAILEIPLNGPKGKGSASVEAKMSGKVWTLEYLCVSVEGGQVIELVKRKAQGEDEDVEEPEVESEPEPEEGAVTQQV